MEGETDAARLAREKAERKAAWQAANAGGPEKKKPLSKAERRALQGAQKGGGAGGRPGGSRGMGKFAGVNLFSHLKEKESLALSLNPADYEGVHPSILALGLQSAAADGGAVPSTSRVESMLVAFKDVIRDFKLPENSSIARELDRHLKKMVQFLTSCRPHTIPMGNAIKHVRAVVAGVSPGLSEAEAKEELLAMVDAYVATNLRFAQGEVIRLAVDKIKQGDSLLTFGLSRVVQRLLLAAHARGTRFKVVVVSCGPHHEGVALAKALAAAGVDVVFGNLTSLSYLIKSVDKVFLGAAALFSNGTLLGRAGTAMVAMAAHNLNKPVLVCAETHKFTEKVQVDSIVYNELGDPDELLPRRSCGDDAFLAGDASDRADLPSSPIDDWKQNSNLQLLNIQYDLTPQQFITAVITEFGMLPASSVPVIVREKEAAMA